MHYTGTIWRPPYEAGSLLLEVCAGCTHHKCKFCTLYADLPFSFRLSPAEHIEADLREAKNNLSIWGTGEAERVFLTGANPFALSAARLLAISEAVHREFPTCRSIGCFARVTDSCGKTDAELEELRRAGYDGLTIGIETADDEALAFMRKGYAAADILAQCQRLDRAGIRYSFFYLAGISGEGRGEAGAAATTALCNQLHPQRIGANMLTVYKNSDLYQELLAGRWREAPELEKYREMKTLVERLEIPVRFSALGASNAIQLDGELPRDRPRLLAVLEDILSHMDERALRRYRTKLKHL